MDENINKPLKNQLVNKGDFIKALIIGLVVGALISIVLFNLHIKFLAGFSFSNILLFSVLFFGVGALAAFYVGYLLSRFWPPLIEVIKFAEVGVLNTALDFGVVNLLLILTQQQSKLTLGIFNTVSFSLAVINSYLWNKFWTFHDPSRKGEVGQFVQFVIVTLVGLLINDGIVVGLQFVGHSSGISVSAWVNISKIIATTISLVWNFFGYKLVVFKKSNNLEINK